MPAVPLLNEHQKTILKTLAFAGMCVGFFIFHIWFRTLVTTVGYEVGERMHDVRKLAANKANLQVQRNRLMGPEGLDRWTREFHGHGQRFAVPSADQLLYAPQAETP